MKEQIDNAIELLKKQDIEGCITGSCLLDYFEGQDVDLFCYNEHSFLELLYFMHYNPQFLILDPLELWKYQEYTKRGKSSLDKLGLVTIKFKYNTCVDINVIFKKHHNNIFDVLSNFDLDLVATGYDIKTGKTISLRETIGLEGTWNKWNKSFYQPNFWDVKRILRQFERVIKYTDRGYNLSLVTDKYISIVEEIIKSDNVFKSDKGTTYFDNTIDQFKIVLQILQTWKKEQVITKEQLQILKTLI